MNAQLVSLAPGSLLVGRYRVTKPLGEGGMASVWEAEHLRLGQRVAIKTLHADLAHDADIVARFEREGRAIAKLRTPHVVRVLDVDTTEAGAPFLVMERLDGRALDAELAERGPLAVGEAVSMIVQACAGVAEAHAIGVVHRDIKPSNLFLAEENGALVVKVLDFGISRDPLDGDKRLTKTESIMGTPLYMAPEQFRSTKDVDSRADVWALGATLYEMLAGRAPFENAEGHVAVAIVSDPIPPILGLRPDVPPGLVEVLEKALAKDRTKRFPSARELGAALSQSGATASYRPPSAPQVSIRHSNSARPDAATHSSGVALPFSTIRQSPSARPEAHTEIAAAATSKIGTPSRGGGGGAGAIALVLAVIAIGAGSLVARSRLQVRGAVTVPSLAASDETSSVPATTAATAATATAATATAATPSASTSSPTPAVGAAAAKGTALPAASTKVPLAKRPPSPQPSRAPSAPGAAPIFFPGEGNP